MSDEPPTLGEIRRVEFQMYKRICHAFVSFRFNEFRLSSAFHANRKPPTCKERVLTSPRSNCSRNIRSGLCRLVGTARRGADN